MPGAEDRRLIVLDASIAVRWVTSEKGSNEAASLLERECAWLAPRLLLSEAASALRRKTMNAEISSSAAGQALDALLQAVSDGLIQLAEDERFIAPALLLALSVRHKLPDCLYLAIAERSGAALATADAQLARLARHRGIEVFEIPQQ